MNPLSERITAVLAVDPEAPAVQYRGRWHAWGDLEAVGRDLESRLVAAGLTSEHAVGVVLRNRPEVVGAMLGLLAAGRPVVALSPLVPEAALAEEVEALRPATVVATAADWTTELRGAVEGAGGLGLSLTGDATEPVAVEVAAAFVSERACVVPEGVAVSILTSGTTGPPKRVLIRYTDFVNAITTARQHIVGTASDGGPRLRQGVAMVNLPLVHISGMWGVVMNAYDGRRMCLLERFDPRRWAEAVRDNVVAHSGLVPAAMRMVLDAGIPKEWLSSLKAVRVATAPLDPAVSDEFERRYGIPVLRAYGATEFAGEVAGWTIADHRQWGEKKKGSVGRPHPGVGLRVIDADSGLDGPVGETGVLLVRSPHSVGATAADWVRTNDLAHLDEDGFLWIDGRADDVIVRGGFKVTPAEVEQVLEQHPAVRQAAVTGLPDERLGEIPAAAVELVDGSDADELTLRAWARERLPAYKVPVTIKVVDRLPRNPALKVPRPELRALLE